MISRRQIIESQQELVQNTNSVRSSLSANNNSNRNTSASNLTQDNNNKINMKQLNCSTSSSNEQRASHQLESGGRGQRYLSASNYDIRQLSRASNKSTNQKMPPKSNSSRLQHFQLQQRQKFSINNQLNYSQAPASSSFDLNELENKYQLNRTTTSSSSKLKNDHSSSRRRVFNDLNQDEDYDDFDFDFDESQANKVDRYHRRDYRSVAGRREELDDDFDDDDDDDDDEEEDVEGERNVREEEEEDEDEDNRYRHFDPYSVYGEEDEEEDVWYSEERLFEDHIQEIIDKWLAIDDEIWAKIICMERNRRIAKAYARKHSLTVNGSQDEYLDGTTLGLNSFDNPDRDSKTNHIKQYIGQGLRLKITQNGDILVKRLSKANVFVHQLNQENQFNNNMAEDCDRIDASNSNSNLYALNGSDLYGVVGGGAGFSTAATSFSNYHLSTQSELNNNKMLYLTSHGGPNNNIVNNGTKLLFNNNGKLISSDASTSSSSGNGKSIATSGGKTSSTTNGKSKNVSTKLTDNKKFNLRGSTSIVNNNDNKLSRRDFKQNQTSLSSRKTTTTYTSIALESSKPIKIFDMSKFKTNLEIECKSAYPNRKKLQNQCISIVSFVVDDNKILNLPSWIMIINIVAIDLLKTELGLLDAHDFLFDYPIPAQPSLTNSRMTMMMMMKQDKNQNHHASYTNSSSNNFNNYNNQARMVNRYNKQQSRRPLLKQVNSVDSIVSNSNPMSMMMMMPRRNKTTSNLPLTSCDRSLATSSSKTTTTTSASDYDGRQQFSNGATKSPYNGQYNLGEQPNNGGGYGERQQKQFKQFIGSTTTTTTQLNFKDGAESDGEIQARRNELIANAGGKLLKQVPAINSNIKVDHSSKLINNTSNGTPAKIPSSSSSGFNSNCSSQNDSSATSSSSNIAAEVCTKQQLVVGGDKTTTTTSLTEAEVVDCLNKCIEDSDSKLSSSPLSSDSCASSSASAQHNQQLELIGETERTTKLKGAGHKQFLESFVGEQHHKQQQQHLARGQRPPKLPHRMNQQQANLKTGMPLVSAPIPIPAPPTSSVGGPTGKANLILVSPTGLSPPLQKRKAPTFVDNNNTQNLSEGPFDSNDFNTIKHIDEDGKCSVLVDNTNKRKQKLPIGIPPHAQLAPPATQKHILRYLMSATRNKLANLNIDNNAINNNKNQHLNHSQFNQRKDFAYQMLSKQKLPNSCQLRPLPILPTTTRTNNAATNYVNNLKHFPNNNNNNNNNNNRNLDSQEENLYYCGLQARATNFRHVNHAPTSSSHQSSTIPPPPPNKTRAGLLNSNNGAIEAILAEYRQQQQANNHKFLIDTNEANRNQMRTQAKQKQHQLPATKPLFKFFNNNTNGMNDNDSIDNKNKKKEKEKKEKMFSSVDNINKSKLENQKSSSSILGLRLIKKSKSKKSSTNQIEDIDGMLN